MRDEGRSEDEEQSAGHRMKYVQSMAHFVSCPMRFVRHTKKGQTAHRYILIRKKRLFWKKKATDENRETRSFSLSKITEIRSGKSRLHFSVQTAEGCLDLSGEDEHAVQRWIAYLNAYTAHYRRLANEVAIKCNTKK